MTYEEWFAQQDFYANMRYSHGDKLFIKDGDVYRLVPVQIGYAAWNKDKATAEVLQPREKKEIEVSTSSFYDERDMKLWYYSAFNHKGEVYRARSDVSPPESIRFLKELIERDLGWEVVKINVTKRERM